MTLGQYCIIYPEYFTQRECDIIQEVAEQIIPYLKENRIYFAGADLLGGKLSEINLTSPTCLQEIHNNSDLDPAKVFWDNLK